ncbi:MAG: hypothetical protein ACI83P_001559 [Janthinobacterium sp.]|jgi:hypothetical protein
MDYIFSYAISLPPESMKATQTNILLRFLLAPTRAIKMASTLSSAYEKTALASLQHGFL